MINEIAKDLANTLKKSVDDANKALSDKLDARIKELEQKVDGISIPEMPTPLSTEEVGAIALKVFGYQAEKLIEDKIKEMPVPADGAPGDSVTIDDVKPLINELVSEAVSTIPAPKDGEPGKNADPIDMEEVKAFIKQVIAEEVAKINIPTPKDGEPGKNAMDLEILPEIVPEKSYLRGSYAMHNGGLWRSYEKTHGMRGWEVIVNGVHEATIEQKDDRTAVIKLAQTNGVIEEKTLVFPTVLDKGIFKDVGEYEKFDGVTYGGSFWIAQKDAPEGKPGTSDDWRLAVKRGRDGRESVKVEREIKTVKVE